MSFRLIGSCVLVSGLVACSGDVLLGTEKPSAMEPEPTADDQLPNDDDDGPEMEIEDDDEESDVDTDDDDDDDDGVEAEAPDEEEEESDDDSDDDDEESDDGDEVPGEESDAGLDGVDF